MDYAIVESGGKQYVAREGQALEVDRLPVEAGQAGRRSSGCCWSSMAARYGSARRWSKV